MNTRQVASLAAPLVAALACGGSRHPSASECNLVGWYGVTDTLGLADGLCPWLLGEKNEEKFEVTEDSPGTFKWQLLPEVRGALWEPGTIDGGCQAHLEWSWTMWVIGPEGEEAEVTFHEVRDFRVDATGVSGTRTVTATPSAAFAGLPCTWTGTSAGLRPWTGTSAESPTVSDH